MKSSIGGQVGKGLCYMQLELSLYARQESVFSLGSFFTSYLH